MKGFQIDATNFEKRKLTFFSLNKTTRRYNTTRTRAIMYNFIIRYISLSNMLLAFGLMLEQFIPYIYSYRGLGRCEFPKKDTLRATILC